MGYEAPPPMAPKRNNRVALVIFAVLAVLVIGGPGGGLARGKIRLIFGLDVDVVAHDNILPSRLREGPGVGV